MLDQFDFSSARVKRCGRALTKFDIAYILDMELHYKQLPWCVMVDAFSYSEMRSYLIDSLN